MGTSVPQVFSERRSCDLQHSKLAAGRKTLVSNAVFPRLPGLTFDFKMRPTFSTIIQQAADRSETRIFEDAYPIWEFDLTYEFVRDFRTGQAQNTTNPTNQTELKQIVGFYMARQGQLRQLFYLI